MNLCKTNPFMKRIQSKQREKQKKKRVAQQAHPTVQRSLKYTSQFEEGLMHIVDNEYSGMYQLGELDYEVASEDDQLAIILGYANGLNSIEKNGRYQLFVHNKPIQSSIIEQVLLPYQADETDDYRQEINHMIEDHFRHDQRTFEIEKYAVFSTTSHSKKQAKRAIETMAKNFKTRFEDEEVALSMNPLSGIDRLNAMARLLRPKEYFSSSYEDMAISGLTSKAFIAPSRFVFPNKEEYFRLGQQYGAILYIRQYPKYLEDVLIRELCNEGIELAISIHGRPYNMVDARKNIQAMQTLNNADIQKQQKQNFKQGVSEDMISGEAAEIKQSTEALLDEIKNNNQKLFSGIFTVMVVADSKEQIKEYIQTVKDVGDTWQVVFEPVIDYKEEALNTVLPIGKPYLDVEMNYMRDMTTSNIATQVPFTNVELQSPTGKFYGVNQRTKNIITIDRKNDLLTPSGLIFGTSGSGKGMTTKHEIIGTRLKYPNDRIIIVDPENEYLPIGREFGAEILDISSGTTHHFNLLDMVDKKLLDKEDRNLDLVKEKANLLVSLFESILKEFNDEEASIVDEVTRLTYERVEKPTLVDWHGVMEELGQLDEATRVLAKKVAPYTIGSQDIFAHETNIDLSANFIIFNINKLDAKMKPFAMRVILDQIWNQVVAFRGKGTTWLYFDELQLNFDTEVNAHWFAALWSRIRKYGAAPTGITQNVSTLLDSPSGRKMLSNSEFFILLRQKPVDLQRLKEMIHLTPKLVKYVGERVPQGTGLISSGGIVVPFENPIPKDSKLFQIMNTDA
ncbi:TPA: VirB4-like conjugal transfer ATPase, CD1110 family [Enterococcus faecalis]